MFLFSESFLDNDFHLLALMLAAKIRFWINSFRTLSLRLFFP